MSRRKAAETLAEKGCESDHEFKATRELHTNPITLVYECQDCPNEAHVQRKTTPDNPTVGEYTGTMRDLIDEASDYETVGEMLQDSMNNGRFEIAHTDNRLVFVASNLDNNTTLKRAARQTVESLQSD